MHFITPADPKIILFGTCDTQIYGFGEKNGKLCIYSKSIFDTSEWEEFYMIDINVVKCECCDIGIHVAGGISFSAKEKPKRLEGKEIWIAAREDKYTRIFSINIATKKFTRYQMLQETYPEFALLDLNLCCTCLNPIIRHPYPGQNFDFFVIIPQKYQENVGIFRILVSVNHSEQRCLIWKKDNSFTLNKPPHASVTNILMNDKAEEVLSVIERSEEEDGRITKLSGETEGTQADINLPNDDDRIELVWHEIAFCDGLCLTRRKEGDKNILWIYGYKFPDIEGSAGLCPLDYCTMDENFPSIHSAKFYISWRIVDKEYITKTGAKAAITDSKFFVTPSMITLQITDGSILTIPLRILSLSELAYLSLARIPQSQPLPLLPQFRTLFGQSEKEVNSISWMSQEFIKTTIGWPKILPLIKAPKFPKKYL